MASVLDLDIEITAQTKGIVKALGALEKKTNSFSKNLDKIGSRFSKVLGPIAVSGFFGKIIKDASDAEETLNKFGVVFQDVASKANKEAKDLAKNYGLSSTEAKTLLSDTGDLLTGFGFSGEAALDLSSKVQKLAVDLASFTNFSGGASGASQALTKALLGETESLKSLGIAINQDLVKKKALELAANGVAFATEREAKAQATFALALEQSKNAVGDFERSQDSFANTLKRSRAEFNNLSVELGKTLLPIATNILSFFTDLLKVLSDLDPVLKGIAVSFIGLAGAAGPLLSFLANATKLFSGIIGLVGTLIIKIAQVDDFLLKKFRTTILTIALEWNAAFFEMSVASGGLQKALIILRNGLRLTAAAFKGLVSATGIGLILYAVQELVEQFVELRQEGFSLTESFKIIFKRLQIQWLNFSLFSQEVLDGIFGKFTTTFKDAASIVKGNIQAAKKELDILLGEDDASTQENTGLSGSILKPPTKESINEYAQNLVKDLNIAFQEAEANITTLQLQGGTDQQIDSLREKISQNLKPEIISAREELLKLYGETGNEDFLKNAESISSKFLSLNKTVKDTTKEAKDLGVTIQDVGQQATSGLVNAFSEISDGSKRAKESFQDFANSFLDNISKMILRALLLKSINSAISSFSSDNAGSNTAGSNTAGSNTKVFASGGPVFGPGTATSDSIPAMLSNGEYVIKASSAKGLGYDLLDRLNAMGGNINRVSQRLTSGSLKRASGGSVNVPGSDLINSNNEPLAINVQNNGTQKEATRVTTERDARGTVVNIVLEDVAKNGPISKGLQSTFNMKRGGRK